MYWGARAAPDLNTLAIVCRLGPSAQALPLLAGLPDDVFEHDGQLTKREVRAATLAALASLPGQTLWDVGAGCGLSEARHGAGGSAENRASTEAGKSELAACPDCRSGWR